MPRVAVFVDWQNTYQTAREVFGWEQYPNEYGNYSPYSLARVLAAGNGRGSAGQLVHVGIHRGLPSQKWDPVGYAACRRQAAAWIKENPAIVRVHLRPLRYRQGEPPREKGVDVALAVSAVEWIAHTPIKCDVCIIFSHDSDLLPVVELLTRLKAPECVETAAWSAPGYYSKLSAREEQIHHHPISQALFEKVETRINYAHAP